MACKLGLSDSIPDMGNGGDLTWNVDFPEPGHPGVVDLPRNAIPD